MAAPSYTEDLTDIDPAEDDTDYVALGGGGSGLSPDPDFAIQGTNSITKQVTNARKGMVYNNGAGIAIPAGDHIFAWLFCTTPGLLDTLAVGGLCVTIGNGTGDRNEFHIAGATEYALGGWVCVPIKYILTANGSHPYRTLVGTPSGDPQYFGIIVDTTASVMAVNTSVDVMRYGTGAYITAGDSGDPATFGSFAAQNDLVANRWGILTAIPGGYALQGRFVVGQSNAQVATAAYFDDSNTLVVLVDTFHSETDFTQIIADHADTVFNMTNITILALGTNNPGQLNVLDAGVLGTWLTCTFDGIGITTLEVGITADTCTWRNTGIITQNGATIDTCKISGNTSGDGVAAIVSDDPAKITDCEFTFSDGHAIEITPVGAGPFNITLDGNVFNGYGADASNDAALLIKPDTVDADITISITNGAEPTFKEDASYTGTFLMVSSIAITFTGMKDNTEVRVYDTGDDSVIGGIENATAGTPDNRSFTWSDSSGNDVYYIIHSEAYETIRVEGYIVPGTPTSLPIQQRIDRNYVP